MLARQSMSREDSNFRKNAAGWGILPSRCRPCREGRAARAGGVRARRAGRARRAPAGVAAAPARRRRNPRGRRMCAPRWLPSPPILDGKLDY